MKKPMVSIIIVSYNSHSYLKNCLQSLKKITYRPLELIIVDNNSTDDTVRFVKKATAGWSYPTKIITNRQNFGYAKANNIGVCQAKGEYVFILNPDTVVTSNFLQPLVEKMISDTNIAACQPTVYLADDKKTVNLTGKVTHYLGFDWIKDYRKKTLPKGQRLASFSGSGVLLRKKYFVEVGEFDEQYFMYYEDSDLAWRLRLAGYKIWYVGKSAITHDYKYEPNESYQSFKQKLFYNERNRLYTILKNYSKKSLLLIAPALLLVEFCLVVYSLQKGWFAEKKESYQTVWRYRHYLKQQRGLTQKLRKVSDRELTKEFVSRLTFEKFYHPLATPVLNVGLFIYWNLIRWCL